MKFLKKKISFVIPIYNEEEVIPELIKRLKHFFIKNSKYEYEAVLVENGSTDQSYNLLQKYAEKDKRIKILQLSKNIGTDGGLASGLNYVCGDACIVMMADLQEPLEIVNTFIKKWEEGYDIVYGLVKKRTGGFFRNIFSQLYYKAFSLITSNCYPENASDFRLISKRVYLAVNSMKEQNKYLRGLIAWTGFKHFGIPFNRQKRFAGKSKADFITVVKIALNGMLSFSYLPLRFVSLLGILLILISSFLVLFYLFLFLTRGRETPGITTVILLILIMFGVLFFILGIISEYLARIYEEVKDRPTYIVKNKINLE